MGAIKVDVARQDKVRNRCRLFPFHLCWCPLTYVTVSLCTTDRIDIEATSCTTDRYKIVKLEFRQYILLGSVSDASHPQKNLWEQDLEPLVGLPTVATYTVAAFCG
jgi:hypothetical protein